MLLCVQLAMPNVVAKRPLIIAIVGAEGSGKTVLTTQLKALFHVPVAFEYGKAYCWKHYRAFHKQNQFLTSRKDFLLIANQTYQNYQQALQTACQQTAPFCLLDTDLIYTNWFFQLQFPNNPFLIRNYLRFQKIDVYFFLAPACFFQHPMHYYQLPTKPAFSTALLKNYFHFKHPHSKLIVIRENDDHRRLQIVQQQINHLLNESKG